MKLITAKAGPADLPKVMALIRHAVKMMDAQGIPQWDEIYPDERTLRHDIEKGELSKGMIGGELAAVFVLNWECDPEYKNGTWHCNDGSFHVLHRLCVSPLFQHQGVGAAVLRRAEDLSRAQGIASIRLDAFSQNPYALRMYEKAGYLKVGEVHFRKGLFYLYEKAL